MNAVIDKDASLANLAQCDRCHLPSAQHAKMRRLAIVLTRCNVARPTGNAATARSRNPATSRQHERIEKCTAGELHDLRALPHLRRTPTKRGGLAACLFSAAARAAECAYHTTRRALPNGHRRPAKSEARSLACAALSPKTIDCLVPKNDIGSHKKVECAVRASHAGACHVHRQLQLLSVLHVFSSLAD